MEVQVLSRALLTFNCKYDNMLVSKSATLCLASPEVKSRVIDNHCGMKDRISEKLK